MGGIRNILAGLLILVSTASAADDNLVVIVDYQFIPQHITVKKGSTLVWENREKRQYHSVWFQALGEPEPDYFFPEESYERLFDATGRFDYRCGPHPEMTGSVTVVE